MRNQQLKSGKQKNKKVKKKICSEVSVGLNSPGNPCSQSCKRKGMLLWEGFAEKERFKPGMKERRGDVLHMRRSVMT